MAKLYFRHGAMNSSKSMNLLAIAHNYEELGRKVLLLTPSVDTRSDVNEIASRVGIHHRAIVIEPDDSITHIVAQHLDVDCILVDEAQFLSVEQVNELSYVVDECGISVICYGLRTDFQHKLFVGSKALLEQADSIEEVKTICTMCNHKAIMNARVVDGKRITTGDQVVIGGNESYIPVCRKCYNSMPVYDNEKS